jgi:hypothetical protein
VIWAPEVVDLANTTRATEVPSTGSAVVDQFMPLSQQQFFEGVFVEDGVEKNDPVYYFAACQGQPVYDDSRALIDLKLLGNSDDYDDYDMSEYFAGIQYGCYLGRTITVLEPEACKAGNDDEDLKDTEICVQRAENGYVRGDWTITRNATR